MSRDNVYNPDCGQLGQNITDETIRECLLDFQSDFYSTQKIDLNNSPGFPGGNIDQSYGILSGFGSVLITAPHAQYSYRHECPSSNANCGYEYNSQCQGEIPFSNGPCGKAVDACTGAYAVLLHYITGAPVIWTNYKHDDPNYYHDIYPDTVQTPAYYPYSDGEERIPFKDRLHMTNSQNSPSTDPINLVIDLHGASSSWPWDVDLGTGDGCSGGFGNYCSLVTAYGLTLPYTILNIMNEWGIPDVNYPAQEYTGMQQDSVIKYASMTMDIDAIQFEIQRDWRSCANSSDSMDWERAVKMIRALTGIINNVNVHYGTDVDPNFPGNCNDDGMLNILDIVILTNCILADNCPEDCPNGDTNGDGLYNVLDIVTVVNTVLAS